MKYIEENKSKNETATTREIKRKIRQNNNKKIYIKYQKHKLYERQEMRFSLTLFRLCKVLRVRGPHNEGSSVKFQPKHRLAGAA